MTGNHESLDQRWVALDDLASFEVDEGTMRLARAALARLEEWRRSAELLEDRRDDVRQLGSVTGVSFTNRATTTPR